MNHLRLAGTTALLSLCTAGMSYAQQPAASASSQPAGVQPPVESSQDILVTGQRFSTALVVDVERVALQCIACKRAIKQLRAEAARDRGLSFQGTLDSARGRSQGPGRDHVIIEDDATGFALQLVAQVKRQEQEARARPGRMLNVRSNSDGFLRNLMRYVEPIVERHRLERRAEVVYTRDRPEVKGHNFPDITDAVIQELDRDYSSLDLLADTAR
ncbi:MAG: hypothetical protein ABIN83_02300 [Sphingomicrobium sp.]